MSQTKPVYCRLLGGNIPASLCSQEQGQSECRGCASPVRRCETCGQRPVTNRRFGLCDHCLLAAMQNGWCQHCRKAERQGDDHPYCQHCHRKLVASGDILAGTSGRTKPYQGVAGEALLAKVMAAVHPPSPPPLDEEALQKLPLVDRILAMQRAKA